MALVAIGSVGLLLMIVGGVEISLLELKYNYLRGGFLQAHQLVNLQDCATFLLAYAWFGIVFFGTLAAIWFLPSARQRVPALLAAYHFVALAAGACLVVVVVKYQILSYFSDALDLRLMSSLAGGSVVAALHYVTDEISFFALFGGLGLAAYLAGHFLISRRLKRGRRNRDAPEPPDARSIFAIAGCWAAAAISTIPAIDAVQTDPKIEYGLTRTLPYKAVFAAVSTVHDVTPPRFDLTGFRDGATVPRADWTALALNLPKQPPNLLVFVLESTRAEAVGKEIDGKLVAPHLTALAEDGSIARSAFSHAGFTVPSVEATFTGKLSGKPSPSLFSVLKRHGYRIAVVSAQDESLGDIDKIVGMRANADFFFDATSAPEDRVRPSREPGSMQLSEHRLLSALRAALEDGLDDRPQFFYINVQAPHFPYDHREMARIITDHPIARRDIDSHHKKEVALTYWNAVANADNFLGDAIRLFRERGLYQNTLLLVIGDHGESLFDDQFLGHGHALNDIQTRIPFVLNRPGISFEEPIGEDEIPGILLRQLCCGNASCNDNTVHQTKIAKAVFQYIGEIVHPTQIGMVENGGRRTVIDFRASKVLFTDLRRWFTREEILRDGALRDRVRQVVALWDAAR